MTPARTLLYALVTAMLPGASRADVNPPAVPVPLAAPQQPYRCSPAEDRFLDDLERDTFAFFWSATPSSGLTPDRVPGSDISSVAAIGFALTSYAVGVQRGFVSRADAAARTRDTLDLLWRAPQGADPQGMSGFNGLFYHFLDPRRGRRAWDSELSTIDTALLMAGVLTAQTYFDGPDEVERSIRDLADQLYRRVDWTFAYSPQRKPLLSLGWSPETGFLAYDWAGYSEGMILYLLALGSPTHAVDARAWDEWTRSYQWSGPADQAHVAFGPLFGHQYSHVWIDFRGIQDRAMQAKGSDYFENSVRATYANRAYCMANPQGWKGYGELAWGLTASDGPPVPLVQGGELTFHAYWARGVGPDGAKDDGTIAPTAAGGSVPFAPEIAIPTLRHFREAFGDKLYGKYGFKDAFNLSYPAKDDGAPGWFSNDYLAIDQGPILLMIENYRSGLVWNLLKKNPYVTAGLRRAGFTGGWLRAEPEETQAAR